MTDNNHPITPPPELILGWCRGWNCTSELTALKAVATQAARWGADQQLQLDAEQINQAWQKGADQELDECCKWVAIVGGAEALRAARRPKPPSLKELNLKHLEVMERDGHYLPEIIADLRRAIESLTS